MIGTIVNTCTIIIGSLAGAKLKQRIRPEWQGVLYTAMGLASLSLGFNAVCKNMPESRYPVLFVISLALGSLLGTMMNLAGRFDALVDNLKRKKQTTSTNKPSGQNLAQGLSTGILLYCIGTLSILGPINSALLGDETFLLTNATLDLVTSAVLTATYGYGMVWAAPVLFCHPRRNALRNEHRGRYTDCRLGPWHTGHKGLQDLEPAALALRPRGVLPD